MGDVTIRLRDVPEMGYFTSDKPPRGEVCVKTSYMISGYYKNQEETDEKFQNGFFCTGDIGAMERPGFVRVIDRKKNIFKLAQGEFVAPEKIEGVFESRSNLIEQVYLYGNIYQNNVVAVIIPHIEALKQWKKSNNDEDNESDASGSHFHSHYPIPIPLLINYSIPIPLLINYYIPIPLLINYSIPIPIIAFLFYCSFIPNPLFAPTDHSLYHSQFPIPLFHSQSNVYTHCSIPIPLFIHYSIPCFPFHYSIPIPLFTPIIHPIIDIVHDIEHLCNLPEVNDLYMNELRALGQAQGLQGWEIPASIIIDPQPFTVENHLLTCTMKKSRPQLEKRYKMKLEALYDAMERAKGKTKLCVCVSMCVCVFVFKYLYVCA